MPKRSESLRRAQSQAAISRRWGEKRFLPSKEPLSDDDLGCEMKPNICEKSGQSLQDHNNFQKKLDLPMTGDLVELCKYECGSRRLTTLLYIILHDLGHQWRIIDDILQQIGVYLCKTAHKWAETFLSGDFEAFVDDGPGRKHSDSFCDTFPELEVETKSFVSGACSRKSTDYNATELPKFIDTTYYELTQAAKVNVELIRS